MTFSVEHIDIPKDRNCWPLQINQKSNQDGEILRRHSSTVKVKSLLTDAKYEIRPKVEKDGESYKVLGYTVSMNPPACTVRNNAFLDIQIHRAGRCTQYMLQYYLLVEGCPWDIVQHVTLEHAVFNSVTMTFLMPLPPRKKMTAFEMIDELRNRAHTLKDSNRMRRTYGLLNPRSFEKDSCTFYMDHSRDMKITAYVKAGSASKAFCDLPKDLKDKIYAESQQFLRLEVKLTPYWFNQHDEFRSGMGWKNLKAAKNAQSQVFGVVHDMLGLSLKFRRRAPKPEYCEILSPAQKTVLDDYLSGTPISEIKELNAKSKQYVSKIKKAIWKTLHIDLDLPWKDHVGLTPLEWFKCPDGNVVPATLADLTKYMFVRDTVKDVLVRLRDELKKRRSTQACLSLDTSLASSADAGSFESTPPKAMPPAKSSKTVDEVLNRKALLSRKLQITALNKTKTEIKLYRIRTASM
ncbi:MAG: hypothetical protein K2Q97_14460 [Burkholderiaceae bacterium]|nr:hypothetical protein [Burkholderiaceae bacterium]